MQNATEQVATTTACAIGAFMFVMLLAVYTAGMYQQITLKFHLDKTVKVVKK